MLVLFRAGLVLIKFTFDRWTVLVRIRKGETAV